MKKFRNLNANEIDVRINQIAKNYCTILLYKDARCDMNILDETVGAMNWKKSYLRDNANCVVSIYDEDKKEWVSKEDTGTESFTEQEKGLASDSFKRACFNWGIGRELYSSPNVIIFPKTDMVVKDKDGEFFDKGNGKFDTKTRFYVEYIGYDSNDNICDLIIRDNKNNIRFSELTKETERELNDLSMRVKKLIDARENLDDNWDREQLYKYYKVSSDAQLTKAQKEEIIKLMIKEESNNEKNRKRNNFKWE